MARINASNGSGFPMRDDFAPTDEGRRQFIAARCDFLNDRLLSQNPATSARWQPSGDYLEIFMHGQPRHRARRMI